MDVAWTLRGLEVDGKHRWVAIFDGEFQETVPEGFHAVRVPLNARTDSSLDWTGALDWAASLQEKGYWLWWDLDFGLFEHLSQPVDDQAQLATLALAIGHFTETVWPRFVSATLGVNIYRGQVPCRDVAYLDLLASEFPGETSVFATLDARAVEGILHRALLTSRETYQHVLPIVTGGSSGQEALAWGEGASRYGFLGRDLRLGREANLPSVGLCLPPVESYRSQWEEVVSSLPFESLRLVPEALLTTAWDELETLHVIPEGVTSLGQRKLQGFKAAGGEVVELASPNCQKT